MSFFLSIILSVVARLIPHPANVTPLGALIFANSQKSGVWKGIALGLIVMVITDIFLGFSFSSLFVYLGFVSYALLAQIKKINPIAGVLLGSISFFLISNFGVWLGGWYDYSFAGLTKCYVMALPFFRNMLIGDLVFITGIAVAQSLMARFNIKFDWNMNQIQNLRRNWNGKRVEG